MKTGRTQMSIGSMLLAIQLFSLLATLRSPGGLPAVATAGGPSAIGFWIGFCLPGILGILFLVLGIRRRKKKLAMMRDPNQTDPWNR